MLWGSCFSQALFLTKGLAETTRGWMFSVPQYRLQLARCLLLLSCGPVAITFAVDLLKLRRRENLLRPPRSTPTGGKGAVAPGNRHPHAELQQVHEHGDRPNEQRDVHLVHDKECCTAEVYGQLISPSALDDLARADFLLFDKGTTVNGTTLHLHGVCAGGVSFASHHADDDIHTKGLPCERHYCETARCSALETGASTLWPYQKTLGSTSSRMLSTNSVDHQDNYNRDISGSTPFNRDGGAIQREDLSAIQHYYSTHRDERSRLEVLAQVRRTLCCTS